MAENARDESEEFADEFASLVVEALEMDRKEKEQQEENDELERLASAYADEIHRNSGVENRQSQHSQQISGTGSLDIDITRMDEDIDEYYNRRPDDDRDITDELNILKDIEKNESRPAVYMEDSGDCDFGGSVEVKRTDYLDCLINALEADKTTVPERKEELYQFLGIYTLERLLVPYDMDVMSANQSNFREMVKWVDDNREAIKEQLDIYYRTVEEQMRSVLFDYFNTYKDTDNDELNFIDEERRKNLTEETKDKIRQTVITRKITIGNNFAVFCSQLINAITLKYLYSYSALPGKFIEFMGPKYTDKENPKHLDYPFNQGKFVNAILFPGFFASQIEQHVGNIYDSLLTVLKTLNDRIKFVLESGLIYVIRGVISDKSIERNNAIQEILNAMNEILPLLDETGNRLEERNEIRDRLRLGTRQVKNYKRVKRVEMKPKAHNPVYNMKQIKELIPFIKDILSGVLRDFKLDKTKNKK